MASQELINIIIKATDNASQAAKKVDDSLKKIGNSSNKLGNVPGFDTLKSKLGSVATTVDGKLGGALTRARAKFNTFKSTLSNVGSSIKGKFGSAIDGVRNKLSSFANGSKTAASGLNFLKGAASMAVGILGADLVSSLMESTRASLNARSSIQAFGQRLNMSGDEVSKFQSDLDQLQSTFKKVDMDVVGQQAMDMAYRLNLPKESLTQLTETSAIFTDAMVRNGRSSEDATLALADAMDGEFRRLKEIGISQDDLMKNGWSGDINDKTGLLNAMNKALKDQHYDELAKSVDSLDDAWQVLSITLSNLLETILLPLTPAIVGIINGFTSLIDGIKNAWNGLPDFAQLGIGIGIVAGAIVLIASVLWTTYIPAWIAAASATWAAIAPVLPIVIAVGAAIGLLVAAIFEVGKAFGWWSDVGGMFDAIKDGIMRMWDAFINHPDVQAAIQIISSALSTLWSLIQQAGQAILEFFGVSTGGEWDIVRSLIEGIGLAWQLLTTPIRTVIGVVMALAGAFSSFYSGTLVPLGEFIMNILGPVFETLGTIWSGVMEQIGGVVSVFQQFANGQTDLVTVITTVATSLWNIWMLIASNLLNLVMTLASNLLTWAIQAGLNFLTGIVTYLSQVPGRVFNYLVQTTSRIIVAGAQWVSRARSAASRVVSGVISFLSSLPGRVASAIAGVVTAIISAGTSWVNAAREKAQSTVDGARDALSGMASAISGALSGVVDAIVSPFREAYNTAKGIWDSIANLASSVPQVNAGGGDIEWSFYGDDDITNMVNTGDSVVYTKEESTVDVNNNVVLDFKNVPAHIDTDTLISAMQDKKVLKSLTNNPEFQSLDANVKNKLNLKVNRARGI